MACSWLAACLAVALGVPLSGVVVDSTGRPVAAARVWLGDTVAPRPGPETLATAETDAAGRFRLERDENLKGRGQIWSPTLWAYKPGLGIAHQEFKKALPGPNESVRLELGAPATSRIRVLLPDGKPAQGARVRPADLRGGDAPQPPSALLEALAVTTDDSGRTAIDGLKIDSIAAVDVTARGRLFQCLAVDPHDGEVQLLPVGKLSARIVADDPKILKGWKIKASSHPIGRRRGPYLTHWAAGETNASGAIEFPELAAGLVGWEIKPPTGVSFIADQPPATITAGETTEARIIVRRAVRVEGTVREEPGGSPIAGVEVLLHNLTTGVTRIEPVRTDAAGKFSQYIAPGSIRFSFHGELSLKDYFLPPGRPHWVDFKVEADEAKHELTPPRLHRAVRIRGKVVDALDKPVVGAMVTGKWISPLFGNNPNSVRGETDAQGEFEIGSIAPDATVVLIADDGGRGGVSEKTAVNVAKEPAAITLRLGQLPTTGLSGIVLDADGDPLPGAEIRVFTRPLNQHSEGGSPFDLKQASIRSRADGRYDVPPVLPTEAQYRVRAEAAGFAPAMSAWLEAPKREVPQFKLRRLIGERAVEGSVLDTAGRPIAGAEVFQSGDGPKRTRTETDAAGRFRLVGVRDAPAIIFVSKDGYRFTGRRIERGANLVEIQARRFDERVEPLTPAPPFVDRGEEREIARELIDAARAEQLAGIDFYGFHELPALGALIDPDRVLVMIRNQVIRPDSDDLVALAIAYWERSPGDLPDLLDAIEPPALARAVVETLRSRLGSSASVALQKELSDLAQRAAEGLPAVVRPSSTPPAMTSSELFRALGPAFEAKAKVLEDPAGARAKLRESISRLEKLGPGRPAEPLTAVVIARLLPLALRVDPDRAEEDLWLAIAKRPSLPITPEFPFENPGMRRDIQDLAELAARIAPYNRSAAEVVIAPVRERFSHFYDEAWGLGNEGPAIFRAIGAYDARIARDLLNALPADPPPQTQGVQASSEFRHQSKTACRFALARALALPPALRLRGSVAHFQSDVAAALDD